VAVTYLRECKQILVDTESVQPSLTKLEQSQHMYNLATHHARRVAVML
jgi:hypothetical protein